MAFLYRLIEEQIKGTPLADQECENVTTDLQGQGWFVFKDVVAKFFGNNQHFDYKNIVERSQFKLSKHLSEKKDHRPV